MVADLVGFGSESLALLTTSVAAGQDKVPLPQDLLPEARHLAPPAIDFSRVFWDEPGDGAIWARGRNYKASFDERGATFIPYMGFDAPRNYRFGIKYAF